MTADAFDDILVRINYLKREAEDVYAARTTYPHYIEMDTVINALAAAASYVRRAKEDMERVVSLHVKSRS